MTSSNIPRLLAATTCLFGGLAIAVTAQLSPVPPTNLRVAQSSPPPEPCAIPDKKGGEHSYFDMLVRLGEHSCNWSLRSQAQLDALTAAKPSTHFTYVFGQDTHPHAQDAAKFVMTPKGDTGGASVPSNQQLWMPISLTAGSVLLTWDWYWAPDFRENYGGVTDYKAFQLLIDGHAWWTLMWNIQRGINLAPGNSRAVTTVSDELRSGPSADGMISKEVVNPTGREAVPQRTFVAEHGVWTRYWIEIRMFEPPSAFTEWSSVHNDGIPIGPNEGDTGVRNGWIDSGGKWHMVSLWMADENRDAVRLLYRAPFNFQPEKGWRGNISRFRFEMNSSKSGLAGPLVGYGRNAVVLHNYKLPTVPESDTLIFQRPKS